MKYRHDLDLDFPLGFYSQSAFLGIKKKGKLDTAILYSKPPANWGGVFSQNRFRSYCIEDALSKAKNKMQLLAVFSGNANNCNGFLEKQGMDNLTRNFEKNFFIAPSQILFSFTGIIGFPFPDKKVTQRFQKKDSFKFLKNLIQTSEAGQHPHPPFYQGILTTDTRPKKIAVEIPLKKGRVRLAACAKGAGMIAPNMATMLAYLTTDLKVSQSECRKKVREAVGPSFNSISVDGDTSTNDSVFLLANGASGMAYQHLSPAEQKKIDEAIKHLYLYLAKEIVRDGEGASKFVTINISGAPDNRSAFILGKKVGHSLLVKTALHGNDPNYGRILMALGNAGVPLALREVRIKFGRTLLYANEKLKANKLKEISNYMKKNKEILIDIRVGAGKGTQAFYTCDLSYDYVRINAEYTT